MPIPNSQYLVISDMKKRNSIYTVILINEKIVYFSFCLYSDCKEGLIMKKKTFSLILT